MNGSKIPYNKRWEELLSRFAGKNEGDFRLVKSKIVNSENEAQDFYQKMIAQGEEGAILKNFDFLWEGKRVRGVGKMKEVIDATLKVVGVEEGTGKNKGKLGALVCESQDGRIKVNVGTGFSDEQREMFWSTPPKFADVAYNAIIDDKSTRQKSLFLPRFVKERADKEEADLL